MQNFLCGRCRQDASSIIRVAGKINVKFDEISKFYAESVHQFVKVIKKLVPPLRLRLSSCAQIR